MQQREELLREIERLESTLDAHREELVYPTLAIPLEHKRHNPSFHELHEAIRQTMLDKGLAAFDKRRHVEGLVTEALSKLGAFYRTSDGRAFFFSNNERRLIDIEQRQFQHLLTDVSGLSATETVFRFVMDMLQARANRSARLVDVHTLSYFDTTNGLIAVSDGGGGMWLRERGGKWKYAHNGEGGLLFLTESDSIVVEPDFSADSTSLEWYLDLPLFANAPLSRHDQMSLDYVALLQNFFPTLRRTRIIPAALGPQGSGKTSWMRARGVLLVGQKFDVTGIHRDREDAFVAAVTNRTVVGLDNADSRVSWLPDALATYATGLRYRLRRLYSTNEEVSYKPRAVLMMSSRDPHFNRPDVAERLLPLYFDRPDKYEPEGRIFDELGRRRGAIWGQLLRRVGEIADYAMVTHPPALPFRMADFATFGWVVFDEVGDTSEWNRLLASLERVQASFASDGDGVVEVLRLLLERQGSIGPVGVHELFQECYRIAEQEHLPFPRTTKSFGRRLSNSRRVIELELSARLHEERRHERKRWVSITRAGDFGDFGDNDSGKI